MTADINARLEKAPVVPLIEASDPAIAVQTAVALKAGGLTVLECVLRTDAALDCLAAIADCVDDVIIGAGTVLTPDQAQDATARGSQFIVSPGLVDEIVTFCAERSLPCYPGTMTAGEVQRAYAQGLRDVKFFPATLAGGVPMLRALGSVFRDMRFMPTGGVNAANLSDFLSLPHVLACGGSWLTPPKAIAEGDFATVERLAREAVEIATTSRRQEPQHV